MKNKDYVLVIALSLFLYVFWATRSIHKWPLGDEIYQVAVIDIHNSYQSPPHARNWGLWGSPTLYGEALLALAKMFKPDYVTAHLLGMFLVVVMLLVMHFLAHEIFIDKKASRLVMVFSVFIYSTHPMVIQGSLLMDRDNTFFTLFLSLFLLFFLRDRKKKQAKYFGLCVLMFTLMMWGKLTPLPLMVFSLLLFEVLSCRERLLRDLLIVLTSMGLFAASWFAYCVYFPREGVAGGDIFVHFLQSAGTRYQSSTSHIGLLADIMKTAVYVILWLNPFFFALSIFYGGYTVRTILKREKLRDMDILTIFSVVIFIGYLLYGRMMFGFPKYHYPMLFMLSIMVANVFTTETLQEAKNKFTYVFLFVLTFLFYVVFLDDVYRVAYFDVKKSLIDTGAISRDVKVKLLVQYLLLSFSFACVAIAVKRPAVKNHAHAFLISLFICGMALNFSQNTFQMAPDVSTVSCYGETGTSAMLDYVRNKLDDGKLALSSTQIMYYLKLLNKRYHPEAFFNDRRNILKELMDAKVQFFIYGVNTHTLGQVTEVFNSQEIKEYLQKHFSRKNIGTYTVWERKQL